MTDIGLLVLRVGPGALLIGHGTQKLFGWFGGPGLAGAGGWFESLGLAPGRAWATLSGMAEAGGGLLLLLGFLHPRGPIAIMAGMTTAYLRAHRGRPIRAQAGGGELAVAYPSSRSRSRSSVPAPLRSTRASARPCRRPAP
jgi:putative oxidoreductase